MGVIIVANNSVTAASQEGHKSRWSFQRHFRSLITSSRFGNEGNVLGILVACARRQGAAKSESSAACHTKSKCAFGSLQACSEPTTAMFHFTITHMLLLDRKASSRQAFLDSTFTQLRTSLKSTVRIFGAAQRGNH